MLNFFNRAFSSTRSTSRRLRFIAVGKQQNRYRIHALVISQQREYTEGSNNDKKKMEDDKDSRFLVDNQREFFVGREDRYNGIIVDSRLESCQNSNFAECLKESLGRWKRENKSTIWFHVDLENADWIPVLAKEGFKFHHAKEGFASMYKWLPTSFENNIPPYAHTNLGVGGFVLNDDTDEILVVKEKRSLLEGQRRWKLPGGIVDPGENIPEAVIREVREETGIFTEFVNLVGFRHAHGYAFGCSDIYIVACLKPLNREINKCEREIEDCRWMKLEDYANDPNIVQNNRIFAQAMLQYTKNRVGLNLTVGEHPLSKKPVSIYLFPSM